MYDILKIEAEKAINEIGFESDVDSVADQLESDLERNFSYTVDEIAAAISNVIEQWKKETKENYI